MLGNLVAGPILHKRAGVAADAVNGVVCHIGIEAQDGVGGGGGVIVVHDAGVNGFQLHGDSDRFQRCFDDLLDVLHNRAGYALVDHLHCDPVLLPNAITVAVDPARVI